MYKNSFNIWLEKNCSDILNSVILVKNKDKNSLDIF